MIKSRRQGFGPQQLLPSILAGLVIGALIVNIEISLASLIFSGSLSPYLAAGLGFTLFGAMVIGVIVALTSSYPGAIAMPISNPVPILALMAAAIAQRSVANASADAGFASAVTALALTGILSGALLLALGRFKLGGLIPFVPYPVIGGFLAGTGWLLVQGAIGTMAGVPFVTAQLPRFVEPDMMVRWIPGVFFGVLLFIVLRRYNHFLMLPGLLVAGTLFFDLFLLGRPYHPPAHHALRDDHRRSRTLPGGNPDCVGAHAPTLRALFPFLGRDPEDGTPGPDLAAALHKWIARLMAERLAENNTALAAMMD